MPPLTWSAPSYVNYPPRKTVAERDHLTIELGRVIIERQRRFQQSQMAVAGQYPFRNVLT